MAEKLDIDRTDGWRKYLFVSPNFLDEDRQKVVAALDELWEKAPEFREMLPFTQKSAANTGIGKIIIEKGESCGATYDHGRMPLNLKKLDDFVYKTQNGDWAFASLRSAIFHETVHLTDGAMPQNLDLVKKSADLPLRVYNKVRSSPNHLVVSEKYAAVFRSVALGTTEPLAVHVTNEVMHRHFGEAKRGDYLDVRRATKEDRENRITKFVVDRKMEAELPKKDRVSDSFIPLPIADTHDPDNRRSDWVQRLYDTAKEPQVDIGNLVHNTPPPNEVLRKPTLGR